MGQKARGRNPRYSRRNQTRGPDRHRVRRRPEPESPLVNQTADAEIEYWPALLTLYPELAEHLPWTSLRGAEVTSVPRRLARSRHLFGDNTLYLKNEEEDFHVLPENKARKLEFVLGDTLAENKKRLVSFGYVGSPHCYAVAKAAYDAGLKSTLVLQKAPLTLEAIEMLAALKSMGSNVKLRSSRRGVMLSAYWQWLLSKVFSIRLVPPSDPWSCLGHVNAILEMAEQIDEGLIEKPDAIYVPVGSGATLVGMEIGKRLADLDSVDIVGVQVSDSEASDPTRLAAMANDAVAILNRYLKEPLVYTFKPASFTILRDYMGASFGRLPEALQQRMEQWKTSFESLEGIELDPHFAAKTAYALYDQIQKNTIKGKVLLLWNTTCPFRRSEMPADFKVEDSSWRLKRWIREDQREGRLLELRALK